MNFHLQFHVPASTEKLKYSHKSLFIGSCFADNIGELFQHYKFDTVINPHGILYNPASIAIALHRYMDNDLMTPDKLFLANESWNSWEHHSRFSNSNKEMCLKEINENIFIAHEYIKNGEWLFITFGSAFAYTLNSSEQLVGNCHKQPQQEFTKRLLEIDEIAEEYNLLIEQLKKINNKLKIVFTISPVRYIRDGVVENNISKARLIEAVHRLVKQNGAAYYFPAYELVMDDLRDYRFFKADLVHPNEQATEYVFEKLINAFADEETSNVFEKIKDIILAKDHKPLNKDSEAYRKFKETYLERTNQLQSNHAFIDLKMETQFFGK